MIGETLGPYRIDRELGSGGMGKVYAATVAGRAPGLEEGTHVALKVVHPHLLQTPGFFKRFLREAEIGKSVVHDNVVRTIDCDAVLVGGVQQNFLVMEYVEGQTLRGLLHELTCVPEDLCRHIGREAARGLAAIHAAGVLHRDVKPENVLITQEHVVKVMDLGVARLDDEVLRLSQTGAFVGSLHYSAPECFQQGGADVGGRADLHALGLVLYELATGTNPYFADAVQQVLGKVLHEEPRRLGDVNPQLSPFFEEVVHCLLAKEPDERFADATTLFDVLVEGEDSSWWQARAKAIQTTTRRPIRRIRIPRETAVYGREEELATLSALFDQAKDGEGQVVLLQGEAGIGKSRLVDELIGRLQRGGEDLNFLFGSYPPGGAATVSGAFSAAFHEHFGADGAGPYLTQTPLLVPAFEALLRGDIAPEGAQPLTMDSIGTCFVRATHSLAYERPTIVLIDDLHFAPEEAQALFSALAMSVSGHRVLLIGSTRPGPSQEWVAGLTRLPHTTPIPVPRLGPKDLVELLQDSFQSETLASSLAAQIALKSDGNPFFAFEIIRGLREGQFITQQHDGSWVSTQAIGEIRIPSSVLDLVNARVAGLTEDERALLDVAACCGYEFDPGLVGDALGLARIPTLRAFGQIERQHRLVRASGRAMVFDHHQVQEALYGKLLEQLREEYHAVLAQALETRTQAADQDPATLDGALCVDLCEHYLKGVGGERALRYLDAAQTHLEKGYVHAQVVELTERALAAPDLLTGVRRAQALVRLARALDPLGRRGQQEECAREALRLAEEAGNADVGGQAARALGNVLVRTSRPADAEAMFRRACDLARVQGDRHAEAYSAGNLASALYTVGRFDEAQVEIERSLAIAQELGDRQQEALCTGSLGNLCYTYSRFPEAQAHYERWLSLAQEIGDQQGVAGARGCLGGVFWCVGRYPEAEAQYEQVLAHSRETGHREGEAQALQNLGLTWHAIGDCTRARRALEESLALCREIGAGRLEGYALYGLGNVADDEGDAVLARTHAEASLALRRQTGNVVGVADSLAVMGDLERRAGDVDAARAALEEAAALSREQGRIAPAAYALALLACLPGGDAEAAQGALAEAGESGQGHEVSFLLWQATGDPAHLVEAKRLLEEVLADVPAQFHEAMSTNLRVHREILAACEEAGL